ncbi:MAG: hypothetical protein AB8G05_01610 [Oligoflexales bacterium]
MIEIIKTYFLGTGAMQLKRIRVYTHIAALFLILSNLGKAERIHSDTNFQQCLEQNTFSIGQLGEDYRNLELKRLRNELEQQFPKRKAKTIKHIDAFIRLSAKDPRLQEKSEILANYLNELHGYSSSSSMKKNSLFKLWLKFNSPQLRSSLAIGRNERCIQGKDSNFDTFINPLKVEIRRQLSGHSSSRQVLNILEQVSFQPAGSKSFFGATADYQDKRHRICVNPEEATPLLVPKIIHELTHAKSLKLRRLNQLFSQSVSKWQSFHMQRDQAEAELYDFEDQIKKQYLSSLETDNLLPKLKANKILGFDQIFAELSKMQNDNPYNLKETVTRRSHSMKLVKFLELDRKSNELFEIMGKARSDYDVERYFDEHRAYLREYFAAVYLSKKHPEVFCKIWVPSYAQKRPVRFFETYLELESRLLSGKFSMWLADLYTFKTKSYIVNSLYKDEQKKEIKKEILKSAKAIVSSQLKQETLTTVR